MRNVVPNAHIIHVQIDGCGLQCGTSILHHLGQYIKLMCIGERHSKSDMMLTNLASGVYRLIVTLVVWENLDALINLKF